MSTMFIRHHVADFAKWKASFDGQEQIRRRFHMTAHSVHRDAEDPSLVWVVMRIMNVMFAKQYAGSESLAALMKDGGVQGTPEIWYAEDAEDKRY